MNKTQLVDSVAQSTGLAKNEIAQVLTATLSAIEDALESRDDVVFRGFGSFFLLEDPGGVGYDPATGEPITYPATRRPRFKAAPSLVERLNRSGGSR